MPKQFRAGFDRDNRLCCGKVYRPLTTCHFGKDDLQIYNSLYKS